MVIIPDFENRVKKPHSHKIVIIANDTTYIYNTRNELIKRLIDEKYEVALISRNLLWQDELKALGCTLININSNRRKTNPLSDMMLLRKYYKAICDEKPSIVLSFNIKPNTYGGLTCRLTHTHYLVNITGLGTAVENPSMLQIVSTRLYKLGVAAADCIFFQNEDNKVFFQEHHMLKKGGRNRMLPGSGVNLNEHKVIPYPQNNKTHFLFVSRILMEKGIDLFLQAAKRIHTKHKDTVFHICGLCDDMKYARILEDAGKSGYIVYHGEQKHMTPFFEEAHCLVHPSYYPEGMSNVLLEAAAHGRPIITTNRAGCRETVDDGKSGYVIPIKDEDALVNTIERFLSLSWEEKRDMGLAGRKKIEKEFDRQFVVEAYIEEIEKIIQKLQ